MASLPLPLPLLLALLLAIPCWSKYTSFKTTREELEAFSARTSGLQLTTAGNMADRNCSSTTSSSMASAAGAVGLVEGLKVSVGSSYVGVAVHVRNYSPYRLDAPQAHVVCGYQVADIKCSPSQPVS